jgi:Hypothetical protein (DUF2513)
MKRDMDVIRTMLLQIEADDDLKLLHTKKPTDSDVYQVLQLCEAKLIVGVVVVECMGGEWILQQTMRPRLTWEGHEFLDAARSESVWNDAKKKIGKALGSVSVTVLKQLLTQLAKQQLGLPQ